MSAANPIELLDDDEGQLLQELSSTIVMASEDPAHSDAVKIFLEFSGSQNRSLAVKLLQNSNYNVELALSKFLPDQDNRDQTGSSLQLVDRSCPKSRCDVAAKVLKKLQPNDTGQKVRIDNEQKVEKIEEEPIRCIDWYNCMAGSIDRFVDPDFSPNQSSLDGRKPHQHDDTEQVIHCVCGEPATAKTVQSDGPNYGRFYLCCGKARRQRGKVNRQNQCKFFQWDDRNGSKGAAGYATRYSLMTWEFFGDDPHHSLVSKKTGFSPSAVRQGAVGNCWFLSALAVVAEKEHLVKQLIPHRDLNKKGCYQINLCLDGKWTPVIVDSHLPVVYGGRIVDPLRGGTSSSTDCDSTVHPAFCAVPSGQLWAALIEKAYAKAHGSYEHLSGGYIQEGFQDMTGAPTETLVFDGNIWDFDDLWVRLLSFHEAGFLMGVATSRGGEGLVGGHAYSVLDVIELNDMLVGEQQSMKDFMKGSPMKKKQRTTIRLVRIRNPWGKKEWKGEWSVNSEQWTKALRSRLGDKSYAKGDGTFFMSYHDMLQRFHHMDVAKCHEGWKHCSVDGIFSGGSRDPFKSSSHFFALSASEKTFAFISIIQPKKRANTKSQYWYADPSFIVLKRRIGVSDWDCEKVVTAGIERNSSVEVFLEPFCDYHVVPFAFKTEKESPFRIACYSAKQVNISRIEVKQVNPTVLLSHLHRHLLRDERRLQYVVGPESTLVCVHGNRCLYFMVVNASRDHILSLRLCVKLQKGLLLSHGIAGDVCDIPPKCERIVMVVSSDGTLSSAVSISFTYATDSLIVKTDKPCQTARASSIGESIELSMVGELIASSACSSSNQNKGGDTIETYQWLAQIGAAL